MEAMICFLALEEEERQFHFGRLLIFSVYVSVWVWVCRFRKKGVAGLRKNETDVSIVTAAV